MAPRTGLVFGLICLLVSPGILFCKGIGVHNYVLLIKDVYNYYKTSCIMFIRSNSCNDLSAIGLMHSWFLELSRRGIFSTATTFSELVNEMEMYYSHIARPLFVVLLDSKESIEEFSMVTGKVRLSFPMWLVLFMEQPGNPLKEFCQHPKGNPFNLMFNTEMLVVCHDHPILKEWYALSDNQTRISNLASWSPERGFILFTSKSLYARRDNMFGETMRIVTVKTSPFVALDNGVLTQFFGEIVLELSAVMNFTVEIRKPVEQYGSWHKEEKAWTGAIGELMAGRADLGVGEFSITSYRLEAVDFTIPLLLTRNRMFFKEPFASSVEWSQYFKAFCTRTWAAILGIVTLAPILLTVIKTRGYFSMKVMIECYTHVWGIYCQQGLPEFPNESSLRLAFFSIFISALIVCSAYSASLISYLTMGTGFLPFNTMEGFANDGTYKLVTLRDTADYDLFANAQDSFFLRLKTFMKRKEELPLELQDAFAEVCNSRIGFYTAEAFRTAFSNYIPCKIAHVDTGKMESLAMILNKHNPYTGLINYHLQRFQAHGILSRLRSLTGFRSMSPDSQHGAVTIWGVAPILAVLTGGMILGCVLLFLERMLFPILNDTKARQSSRPNIIAISGKSKLSDTNLPVNGKASNNHKDLIAKWDHAMLRFGYR